MATCGGPLSEWPGVVTADGRAFLAPAARHVHMYSSATGALLATLRGHTANVTAIALNPSKPHQVTLQQRVNNACEVGPWCFRNAGSWGPVRLPPSAG